MSLADEIADWIRAIVREAGAQGVVLGLSGGIDSAVVAALAHKALPGRVLAAILPCESAPNDAVEARLFGADLGIETTEIDLTPAYRQLTAILPAGSRLAAANIKPRLRMIALYHLAATRHALVCGTSNRTETLIGYSTKHGDSAADLLPIGGLLKRQVYRLARDLGIPQRLIDKPPSAGLWPGQTDEGELGITYAELDDALTALDTAHTEAVRPELLARVRSLIERSAHKRRLPPIYPPPAAP